MDAKLIVGWNEYVALPDWGIRRLRAKIDTGARSCALHVEDIEPLAQDRVRFDIVLSRGHRRRAHVVAPISRISTVRSSTGHRQLRYFTRVRLMIGSLVREVEVSLVDREHMIFRMLLGRTALSGILVDPTRSNLLGAPKKRRPRGSR